MKPINPCGVSEIVFIQIDHLAYDVHKQISGQPMNVKISKSLTCQSEGMGLVTWQLVLLVLHDCPWSFCIWSWFRFRVILYYTVIKPFPSALWTPKKSQQQTIALWFSEKQILAAQYEDRDITHVRTDQNNSYSVMFLLRTHRSDMKRIAQIAVKRHSLPVRKLFCVHNITRLRYITRSRTRIAHSYVRLFIVFIVSLCFALNTITLAAFWRGGRCKGVELKLVLFIVFTLCLTVKWWISLSLSPSHVFLLWNM